MVKSTAKRGKKKGASSSSASKSKYARATRAIAKLASTRDVAFLEDGKHTGIVKLKTARRRVAKAARKYGAPGSSKGKRGKLASRLRGLASLGRVFQPGENVKFGTLDGQETYDAKLVDVDYVNNIATVDRLGSIYVLPLKLLKNGGNQNARYKRLVGMNIGKCTDNPRRHKTPDGLGSFYEITILQKLATSDRIFNDDLARRNFTTVNKSKVKKHPLVKKVLDIRESWAKEGFTGALCKQDRTVARSGWGPHHVHDTDAKSSDQGWIYVVVYVGAPIHGMFTLMYIGRTKSTCGKRLRQHINDSVDDSFAKGQPSRHLVREIQKHGQGNFVIIPLEWISDTLHNGDSKSFGKVAEQRERYWICRFDTLYPKGLNWNMPASSAEARPHYPWVAPRSASQPAADEGSVVDNGPDEEGASSDEGSHDGMPPDDGGGASDDPITPDALFEIVKGRAFSQAVVENLAWELASKASLVVASWDLRRSIVGAHGYAKLEAVRRFLHGHTDPQLASAVTVLQIIFIENFTPHTFKPPLDPSIAVLPFCMEDIDSLQIPGQIKGGIANLVPPGSLAQESLPNVYYKFDIQSGRKLINRTKVGRRARRSWHERMKGRCICNRDEMKAFHGAGTCHVATPDSTLTRDPGLQKVFERGVDFRDDFIADFITDPDKDRDWGSYLSSFMSAWAKTTTLTLGQDSLGMELSDFIRWAVDKGVEIQAQKDQFVAKGAAEDNVRVDMKSKGTREALKWVNKNFTCTHADKFGKKLAWICKWDYVDRCYRTLDGDGYRRETASEDRFVTELNDVVEELGIVIWDVPDEDTPPRVKEKMILRPAKLAYFYFAAKLHKSKFGVRPIHGGVSQPMAPVWSSLTHCLQLLEFDCHAAWVAEVQTATGWRTRGDKCWILRDGTELTEHYDYINECAAEGDVDLGRCRVASADFKALFPSVPHLDLIEKLSYLIHYLFDRRRAERGVTELRMKVPMFRGGPKVDKRRPTPHAEWHEGPLPEDDEDLGEKDGHFYLTEDEIIEFLVLGLKNAHATFGGEVFLQIIGFPQGVNAGPSLAALYLFVYEFAFVRRMHVKYGSHMPVGLVLFIVLGRRFVDDVFLIILDGFDWEDCLVDERSTGGTDGLYPLTLEGPDGKIIEKPLDLITEGIGQETTLLDTRVKIVPGRGRPGDHRLGWGVFDKRDEMTCFAEARTFPHIESKLSEQVKRAVLVGELYRYDRRTSSREELVARAVKIAVRMIRHGYPREWIWRGLDSYRRLLPAKGKWSEIKVEIKRRVEVEWRRSPSKPS